MKKLIGILALSAVLVLTGCAELIDELLTVSDESSVSAETVTESETVPETVQTTEIITEPETVSTAETSSQEQIFDDYADDIQVEYSFRTKNQLEQHFEKHGDEFDGDFDYNTAEEYEAGANDVINNPDALYKTEKDDGDGVYYLESTNEFVILSTDGYIRTYFRPTAGIDYFNRQ
ncbi:MAG: lipoprotein [Ruminococcus sp.]|nr:lipoprotein [Ruminococcus sp.]